jgi:hypothetical protein
VRRSLLAVVAVAGSLFSIYLVTGGTVQEQLSFLVNDAGITAVTHAATCPTRISPECIAMAADAGVTVHRYERLRFPVAVRQQSDGGFDVQLPPMNVSLAGACIEVVDWADCTLDSSAPAVAATSPLLGQQLPFTPVGVAAKWCRAKFDAGLPCALSDGGTYGDRNVSLCSLRASVAQCETVGTGVIIAGDSPEGDL